MDRNAPISIAAAVLVSVIGVFALMIMPLVVGVMVDKLGFTLQQATNIIVAEVAGGALASILAVFWIGRVNWRFAIIGAVAVVIIGNVISTYQTDANTLTLIRFLTGLFGQGTAFALSLAIIGGTRDVDRNFAFVIASQVGFGVLALLSLRPLVDAYDSIGGMYLPLAAFAAATLLLVARLPTGAEVHADGQGPQATGSIMLPVVGLIIMLIWCSGLGAIWNFMERIGVAGGLESTTALQALAISSAVAITGALAASALAGRIGRVVPVTVALVMQIVMIFLLQGDLSFGELALKASVFQVFWNLTGPFIMGSIAASDPSGKISVLIPAAQTSGFFVGPAVVGIFLADGNLVPANYVAIACCAIALVMFIPLAARIKSA
jgi:predicted MFS family arabinose efflux permease